MENDFSLSWKRLKTLEEVERKKNYERSLEKVDNVPTNQERGVFHISVQ